MRKALVYLGVVFIFVGVILATTWGMSLGRNMEDVKDSRAADCLRTEDNIKKQILAANYCIRDEDCRAIDISCPWGGDTPCGYILVNSNHSTALLKNDAYTFPLCIDKNEEIKERYSFCNKYIPGSTECPSPGNVEIKCVDRKCVEVK